MYSPMFVNWRYLRVPRKGKKREISNIEKKKFFFHIYEKFKRNLLHFTCFFEATFVNNEKG